MAIVPSGKMRIMQAQYIDGGLRDNAQIERPVAPGYDGGQPDISPTPEPEIEPEILEPEIEDPEMDPDLEHGMSEPGMEPEMEPEDSKDKKTLSNYIFKKLESFGYPGRRLEEFKKKFVNQDISAEGIETIKIEIPDKKYPDPQTGKTETIESEDLSPIIREINSLFGLNFNGAHRAEGKWTIDFTSENIAKDEDTEGMVRDNLDEIYGQPSKKGRQKAASVNTMEEMIKSNKDDMVSKLKIIIGETDAS
jgi:hypothetical protein